MTDRKSEEMSATYTRIGGTKAKAIADAAKAIRTTVANDHPEHKMETFHLENGFELWCLTCDERVASVTFKEVSGETP